MVTSNPNVQIQLVEVLESIEASTLLTDTEGRQSTRDTKQPCTIFVGTFRLLLDLEQKPGGRKACIVSVITAAYLDQHLLVCLKIEERGSKVRGSGEGR